jgi:predicted nuclease of predicted toxin-antitoxin system
MRAESWRFYLDEDVPPAAAQIGRELGLDVVSVAEAGHRGWPDAEQLAWAAAQSRTLVTYNRGDYLELTRSTLAAGKPHAGVLIVVPTVPRQGAVIAHALQRFSASRLPLQDYEVQFLSNWSADD